MQTETSVITQLMIELAQNINGQTRLDWILMYQTGQQVHSDLHNSSLNLATATADISHTQ